ncbi:MAG: hypothetical protein KC483_03045 [Nitrosarchaeum sp.]|nr:hypothetical protein [Nitrosarchaeum sp.]
MTVFLDMTLHISQSKKNEIETMKNKIGMSAQVEKWFEKELQKFLI